ncbi:hypothetical protein BU15DRAFT_60722 [Melanogaster broomeanus]|nr:hypothetical protein BU15DRAFT_60722 [Melanogaster broomeanus]
MISLADSLALRFLDASGKPPEDGTIPRLMNINDVSPQTCWEELCGQPHRWRKPCHRYLPAQPPAHFVQIRMSSSSPTATTTTISLQRTGGIRLLIFCIRGGRITAVTQNNYRLFYEILCQKEVPIAFVITGLENEPSMEGWWTKNKSEFEKYHCIGPLTQRTGWFVNMAGRLLKWVFQAKPRHPLARRKALKVEELTRRLEDSCGFSQSEAEHLAVRIWETRQESAGPDFVKMRDS